jgi:hypothetical protein
MRYFNKLKNKRKETGHRIKNSDDLLTIEGEEYCTQKHCAELL